jgi:hypothetical protein
MEKKIETNPFVFMDVVAFLTYIWIHPLSFPPKLNVFNTKSTHPHSTLSNAFCWSKKTIMPSSFSSSAYLWCLVSFCLLHLCSDPLQTLFGPDELA